MNIYNKQAHEILTNFLNVANGYISEYDYMDFKQEIMQSFWQGLLKFFILHQAGQSPIYGGKLKKLLQEHGYNLSPGSMYPLLHHLEKISLLHSRVKIFKGRARKYYDITDAGRALLAELQEDLAAIMAKVLSDRPGSVGRSSPQKSP
jgi:PadR family transcriptional regulator PadR